MDGSRYTVELQTADFLDTKEPIQETNCCPPSRHGMTPLARDLSGHDLPFPNSRITLSLPQYLLPLQATTLSPFAERSPGHLLSHAPPWKLGAPTRPTSPPQVVEAWWPLLTIMVVMWANTACRCVMDPGQYPLSYLQHKDKNMEKVFIKFKHRPMNFF
jgi:hypothetical protein